MNPDDPKIINMTTQKPSPQINFPLKPLYTVCTIDGILAIIMLVFLVIHVGSIWMLYTELLNKALELAK